MAAWLIPTLKAILPHVGTILTAAKPVFTKKNADTEPNQVLLLQQQIAELQSAASSNSDNTKELAAQLQSTVAALEEAATIAQAKLRLVFRLSILAVCISLLAVGVALYGVLA